jgi:hypothetical protein
MGPSRRNPHPQATQSTSPVEVSIFSTTSCSGGHQNVKQAPSSSDAQSRYTERLRKANEVMSKALEDIEKAQPSQYHALRTILDPPSPNPQNGITPLSKPEKLKAAAASVV